MLAYAISTDATGKVVEGGTYLHMVLLMAVGPITDIRAIQLNDQSADTTQFADYVLFAVFTGESDQVSLAGEYRIGTTDVSTPDEWTTKHRLLGIGYLYGLFEYNQDVFRGGAPNIMAIVDGYALYDPREDIDRGGAQKVYDPSTWRWSDNWALCIRDFLVREMGVSYLDLDDDSFTQAAADSDELVDTSEYVVEDDSDSGRQQHKRYRCNGLYETDALKPDVLVGMLAAGAGQLVYVNGTYYLYAGVARTTAVDPATSGYYTLTEDDARGTIEVLAKPGRKDRVNTVVGTFINPAKNYQPDSFPPVTNSTYKAEDGGVELRTELDLPFVQDVDQARRIASIYLKQRRQGIRIRWPGTPRLTTLRPPAVVRVTHAAFGWTNKLFSTERLELQPDGGVDIDLAEYADDIYEIDWTGLPAVDPAPDTDLVDPWAVNPPAAVSAAVDTYAAGDGTVVPRVTLTITPPDEGYVDAYAVFYRREAPDIGEMQAVETTTTSLVLTGLPIGTYYCAVYSKLRNKYSLPRYTSWVIRAEILPPPDVARFSFSISPAGRRVFEWTITEPVPSDVLGIQIRYVVGNAPNATWDEATPLHNGDLVVSPWDTDKPISPGTYTFLASAIDTQGLYSSTPAVLVATIPPPVGIGDLIYRQEDGELGWPGQLANGTVTARGLEVIDDTTWDGLGSLTWDEWTGWLYTGIGPLQYFAREIDLGVDTDVTTESDVASASIDVTVQVAFRLADGTWSGWGPHRSGRARYVTFLLTGDATGQGAIVTRFEQRVYGLAQQQSWDNVDSTYRAFINAGPSETGVNLNVNGARLVNLDVDSTGMRLLARAALDLGGSGAYVEAPATSRVNELSDQWTIAIAFRCDVDNEGGYLISKGYDDGSDGGWALRYGVHADRVVDFVTDAYTGDDPATVSRTTITKGAYVWRDVAVTYDGARLRVYVDGELATNAAVEFSLSATTSTLRIGQGHSGTPAALDATVRNVRLYRRVLAQDEVRAQRNGTSDMNDSALVAYYPCNGRLASSEERDRSSTANHASVSGSGYSRIYQGTRECRYSLAGVQNWRIGAVSFGLAEAVAMGGALVRVSTDGGATWLARTSGTTWGAAFSQGQDLRTQYLDVQVLLYDTDTGNASGTVTLDFFQAAAVTTHLTGDITVQPSGFWSISEVITTAIENVAGAVPTVICREPHAVRVQYRVGGTLTDVVADLLVRGLPSRASST